MSSSAFAYQSDEFIFYGDSKIGCITDGIRGYSWNHSDADRSDITGRNYNIKHLCYKLKDRIMHYCYLNNYERYFYVDDNGVSHYFCLDPDREYKVHQYKDENGTVQYWFEDNGWK